MLPRQLWRVNLSAIYHKCLANTQYKWFVFTSMFKHLILPLYHSTSPAWRHQGLWQTSCHLMWVCKSIQQVRHSHGLQSLKLSVSEAKSTGSTHTQWLNKRSKITAIKTALFSGFRYFIDGNLFCAWPSSLITQMSRRGLLVDHPPCVQAEIWRRESSHRRRLDFGQRVDGEIPGRATRLLERPSLWHRGRENTCVGV